MGRPGEALMIRALVYVDVLVKLTNAPLAVRPFVSLILACRKRVPVIVVSVLVIVGAFALGTLPRVRAPVIIVVETTHPVRVLFGTATPVFCQPVQDGVLETEVVARDEFRCRHCH